MEKEAAIDYLRFCAGCFVALLCGSLVTGLGYAVHVNVLGLALGAVGLGVWVCAFTWIWLLGLRLIFSWLRCGRLVDIACALICAGTVVLFLSGSVWQLQVTATSGAYLAGAIIVLVRTLTDRRLYAEPRAGWLPERL